MSRTEQQGVAVIRFPFETDIREHPEKISAFSIPRRHASGYLSTTCSFKTFQDHFQPLTLADSNREAGSPKDAQVIGKSEPRPPEDLPVPMEQ
jgi:hypothetical protein